MEPQTQAETVAESQPKPESKNQRAYYKFCGHDLTITRDLTNDIGLSAIIWEAGIFLCRYFEKEKIDFTGKKIIELGSGTGIVGILAILLGAEVTLTDLPAALDQIKFNIATNVPPSLRHRSKVAALCWGVDQHSFPSDYDIILGSDIVYSRSKYSALLETLNDLSNPRSLIYLSSKMREHMGAVTFHSSMAPEYFNSEIVHQENDNDINIFKMAKKPPAS
ncbi:EEF1A lysine methyltransferase 3-like [Leucoraja erinacea]|uniref:EEF1A lysine methyltransferase 3-like n=1 Tax=Leucoraja erinaceus TaxID=7782 RepID=UPI0024557B03|nr:EEF1A lysine methyltransferase 3-like [Leucoraja erinacea]